jgi:CheY-like chemotaxis protein
MKENNITTPDEILERYKQAEKSMNPWEYFSKIRTRYTWNKNDSKMIYKQDLYDNIKEYTLVDILKGKQEVVFDHSIILEKINKHLEQKAEVLGLTITELTDEDDIIATINDSRFRISLDNEVEKCKTAGATEHLSKPFQPGELYQKINKF